MATAGVPAAFFSAAPVTAVAVARAPARVGRAAGGPMPAAGPMPAGGPAGPPASPAAQADGSGRSSQSGTPAQAPEPPGVATPATSNRSLPVSGGADGIVMVVVSTARSGAT